MGVSDLHAAGNTAFRTGRHASAERRFTRAIALLKTRGGSGVSSSTSESGAQDSSSSSSSFLLEAVLLENRSAARLAMGHAEASLADANSALELLESVKSDKHDKEQKERKEHLQLKAHYRRARALLAMKKDAEAQKASQAAIAIAKSTLPEVPPELSACDAECKRAGGLNADGTTFSQARQKREEGNAHFKAGRYSDAISSYTAAIASLKEGDDPIPIYNNRALCYQQEYAYKDVISDCNEVLKLEENNVKALVKRAQALEALEKYEDALADVRKVLAIDPRVDQAKQLQHRLQAALRAKRDMV